MKSNRSALFPQMALGGVNGLHWVRRSASVGVARATDHPNDCTPRAQGTFHTTAAVGATHAVGLWLRI
ncbi:MAG TPA: hypothetical protein VMD28_10065 [Acidimicrobiales bacterium]|nr:hypothetical protein [Acidimicrobiales bacterium]